MLTIKSWFFSQGFTSGEALTISGAFFKGLIVLYLNTETHFLRLFSSGQKIFKLLMRYISIQ
jgi:hypothetical protein